jgi:prephenate dehydratase
VSQPAHWLNSDDQPVIPLRSIATLGPEGTSSENAAAYLWTVRAADIPADIRLYNTYEEAGEALMAGVTSHLLVANAYSGINEFYMDLRFSLAFAFLHDTPAYGLAAPAHDTVPCEVRVATHPAPAPLVRELLPARHAVTRIVYTDSTSVAAAKAHKLEIDLALTTQLAAARYNLAFISRTRPIRMLWSAFTARHSHCES